MYLQFECNRLFLLLYLLLFLKKVTPVLVTDLFFAFERIMSSFLFSENNSQVSHIFFWERFSKKNRIIYHSAKEEEDGKFLSFRRER